MATNRRFKALQADTISALTTMMNDFLTELGNKPVLVAQVEAKPLDNGNKIYVGTIFYDSVATGIGTVSVQLFENDSLDALNIAINAYLVANGTDASLVQTDEIILKNGNKSYIAIIGYNISGTGTGGFSIETGTFTRTAGAGSGTQAVTTAKRPKLIFFVAKDSGAGLTGSSGLGLVGGQGNVNVGKIGANVPQIISANAISVWQNGAANGQDATVTAVSNTSFTLTWVKTGTGSVADFPVTWIAITG